MKHMAEVYIFVIVYKYLAILAYLQNDIDESDHNIYELWKSENGIDDSNINQSRWQELYKQG